jgi:hypothetical protein
MSAPIAGCGPPGSAPAKKRSLPSECRSRRRLMMEYYVAVFFALLFEQPFWFWEQKRTRLLDRIDNEGSKIDEQYS